MTETTTTTTNYRTTVGALRIGDHLPHRGRVTAINGSVYGDAVRLTTTKDAATCTTGHLLSDPIFTLGTPDRDRVLTIAIGDLTTYGYAMDRARFYALAGDIASEVHEFGGDVYALTYGDAFGSDGINAGELEHSAVILCGNVTDERGLRQSVARRLVAHDLSSACFSVDSAHEPVFATHNGARP